MYLMYVFELTLSINSKVGNFWIMPLLHSASDIPVNSDVMNMRTVIPHITTFRSTTDRIYDGGPIIFYYNIIIPLCYYYIILYYIILYYIILYYIILYYIILYISCHVIYHISYVIYHISCHISYIMSYIIYHISYHIPYIIYHKI